MEWHVTVNTTTQKQIFTYFPYLFINMIMLMCNVKNKCLWKSLLDLGEDSWGILSQIKTSIKSNICFCSLMNDLQSWAIGMSSGEIHSMKCKALIIPFECLLDYKYDCKHTIIASLSIYTCLFAQRAWPCMITNK